MLGVVSAGFSPTTLEQAGDTRHEGEAGAHVGRVDLEGGSGVGRATLPLWSHVPEEVALPVKASTSASRFRPDT